MKMMKKMIAIALIFVSAAAFAEEKKWNSYLGFGAAGLFSNLNVHDDGNRVNMGGALSLSGIGIKELSGLAIKIDLGAGAATTKDVPNEERLTGLAWLLDLGFGYAFIHSEDTVLALFAKIGWDFYDYNGKQEKALDDVKLNNESISIWDLGIGADISLVKRISDSLHFFASVDVRFPCLGTEDRRFSDSEADKSYYTGITRSITGNISVTPTLGVMWKL